jgi:hypothetical protein
MTREVERKLSQQINALFTAVRIILEGLPNKGGRLVDEAELERERGNPIARALLLNLAGCFPDSGYTSKLPD